MSVLCVTSANASYAIGIKGGKRPSRPRAQRMCCEKHDHWVHRQVRDRPDRPKPTAKGMSERPRLKFCTASPDNAPLMDGFVFAPPDRSILIQPFDVTRFASIPNWLCLAPFSVPGPPQRERPDTPVPSARCCCLLHSHPSSPRTRHPPGLRHPPLASRHPPLFRRQPLDTRCPVSASAGPIPRQSGRPDPAWAKLVCVPASGIASLPMSRPRRPGIGFVLHKEARIHPTLTL